MVDEKSEEQNALNLLDKLTSDQGVEPQDLSQIRTVIQKADNVAVPTELLGADSEKDVTDMRQIINDMKLPQKIKLAMFGNKQARGILIADRNKMVQLFVLKNPRLQAAEVESFTASPNTSDYVLREISNNRDWMKDYNMKLVMVRNPKTPADISLRLVRFLNASDVKVLSRSKNLPQVVSVAARKRMSDLEKRK